MHVIVRRIIIRQRRPRVVNLEHSRLVMDVFYVQSAVAHALEHDDPEDHYSEAYQHNLRQHGEEFLKVFNADWNSEEVGHDCGPDCEREDDEHTVRRALAAWDNVTLHRRLGVVVVARWTKYQRPSKRIGLCCGVHMISQQAWVA